MKVAVDGGFGVSFNSFGVVKRREFPRYNYRFGTSVWSRIPVDLHPRRKPHQTKPEV